MGNYTPKWAIGLFVGVIAGGLIFGLAWDWIVSLNREAVVAFGGLLGGVVGAVIGLWLDSQ